MGGALPEVPQAGPGPDPVLMREVPLYQHWYRIRLSWIFDSNGVSVAAEGSELGRAGYSINAINAGHRRFFERYIL